MNDEWDPIIKSVLIATALYLFVHIVVALYNF
jgi:hypothetical protein